MERDRIEIKKTSLKNTLPDQLMNLVDFAKEHDDTSLLFIASSEDEEGEAVTGCIGSYNEIKKMMIGLSLTTIKTACKEDNFEVFLFLQDVIGHVFGQFSSQDWKKFNSYIKNR